MIVRAYELSLGKRRGKNCIAHSPILHYTNSSWMKKAKAKMEQLQNTPQLIYMSLNKNSVYCVMPRSSKPPDTCK